LALARAIDRVLDFFWSRTAAARSARRVAVRTWIAEKSIDNAGPGRALNRVALDVRFASIKPGVGNLLRKTWEAYTLWFSRVARAGAGIARTGLVRARGERDEQEHAGLIHLLCPPN
jgi:hypothetical protein